MKSALTAQARAGIPAIQILVASGWIWLSFYLFWRDWRSLFWPAFAAGAVWLGFSLYRTFGVLKFGDVQLRLEGHAWPGGALVARLRFPRGIEGARKVSATLECKEVSRTSATSTSAPGILESEVWSCGGEFPLTTRLGRRECRIEFPLPGDVLPTSSNPLLGGNQGLGIYWQLSVHADVPGVDLSRQFVVPVGVRPPGKIAA